MSSWPRRPCPTGRRPGCGSRRRLPWFRVGDAGLAVPSDRSGRRGSRSVETDLSDQDADVAAIATAAWTAEVKEAWRLKLVADKTAGPGV